MVIPGQSLREEKSQLKECISVTDARCVARLIRRKASELKSLRLRDKMAGKFYKIRCKDCGNVQIVFSRASLPVNCIVCGSLLVEPTGGLAKIKGEIIEELGHGEVTS